jgi:hypothetical protein
MADQAPEEYCRRTLMKKKTGYMFLRWVIVGMREFTILLPIGVNTLGL